MRRTAQSIGQENLGFSHDDVGTHSVRSGTSMAIFLDNTPAFLIMLVGRWSSDTFLKCFIKNDQKLFVPCFAIPFGSYRQSENKK